MNRATQRLLPTEINNEFQGSRLALWLFYPFTLLTLWRSQHHPARSRRRCPIHCHHSAGQLFCRCR